MQSKEEVRRQMKATLGAMSAGELAAKSAQILVHLTEHPWWRAARRVALYAPMLREVDLGALWAERGDREFAFPRVVGDRLEFCSVASPAELKLGPFQIPQPAADATALSLDDLDVMIIPGLAFTRDGARLGRGGGFYDRTLAPGLRGQMLALCFHCQLLGELPVEPHDQRMDAVLAEGGLA